MLTQIASVPALARAWRQVRLNRGAAGIDAVSCIAFEKDLDANLRELSRNLLNRTYEPLPSRHVAIPKPGGDHRALSIPCVRDRVAQRAVLDAIEPLFEPHFHDCSFAFRPGRSVIMAVQKIVVARAQGLVWTVESDVRDFFPSIDHQLLLSDLARVLEDADVIGLIRKWIEAGALEEPRRPVPGAVSEALASARLGIGDALEGIIDEYVSDRLGTDGPADSDTGYGSGSSGESGARKKIVRRIVESGVLLALAERSLLRRIANPRALAFGAGAVAAAAVAPVAVRGLRRFISRPAGAPQGSPISPLLSNIHLHPFDSEMTLRGKCLVRYCDDFVVPAGTEAEARETLAVVTRAIARRRLSLHPEKTRIVSPDSPFDFLGYRFLPGNRVVPPESLNPLTRGKLAVALKRVAARLEQ